MLTRRNFIASVAATSAVSAVGGTGAVAPVRKGVRAMYLKLGTRLEIADPMNMKGRYLDECTCVHWKSLDRRVEMIAENGGNVALLDVGEALALPCTRDVWPKGVVSAEEMADHVAAWKRMGVRTVPLLNFSTVHSAWMGLPSRMANTKPYWDFCSRAIAETLGVFGGTKILHVGMDDELYGTPWLREQPIAWERPKDYLWYAVNFYAREAAKAGAKIWMWGDTIKADPDGFRQNVQDDVIVSSRYMTSIHDAIGYKKLVAKQEDFFAKLDSLGFAQIPCCTTTNHMQRANGGEGKYDNPERLASFIGDKVSAEHLKGYVCFSHTAPGGRGEGQYRKACELFGAAFCGKGNAS